MKRSLVRLVFFYLAAAGAASLLVTGRPASAALAPQDGNAGFSSRVPSGGDYVEAREIQLSDSRIAGRPSVRQTVTAWEVNSGSWNGELLDGLSMVLVRNSPENPSGSAGSQATTDCYISHVATPAQRNALLSAFFATQALKASEITAWRIEPAVIRFESAGKTVVVHLGLVS